MPRFGSSNGQNSNNQSQWGSATDKRNAYSSMTSQTPQPKSKKNKIIIIVAAVLAILIVGANVKAAIAERKAGANSSSVPVADTGTNADDNTDVTESEAEGLSDAELEQKALNEVYGEPPAGFRWDDDGNTVPISNENLTAEQVVYQYLRGLAMSQFDTVQKYTYYSTVVSMYNSYFADGASESYYNQFARQVYRLALSSIVVNGMENEAVMANGRHVCTMNITLLDLSYKDWFKDNEDEIFKNMYTYLSGEQDNTKAQQYVFEEILKYYKSDTAKTKDVSIDITLDKVSFGGWLVTDDTALEMLCEYTDGTSTFEYIYSEYEKWIQTQEQEGTLGEWN